MSGGRRPAGSKGGSFRLNDPDHLTDGGRVELRKLVRQWFGEIVAELGRMAAEQQRAGSVAPELSAPSVRDAVAVCRARDARRRAAERSRGPGIGGHPSLATGSAILVTISSVATPSVTPYLHSPWQWAVFALSAISGAVGLCGQWLARAGRTAR